MATARSVELAVASRPLAAGRPGRVATLLDGAGAGRQLWLVDGGVSGSLGGPELLDAHVARRARGMLDEGRSNRLRFGADGATMGDELRVHIRFFALPPRMVIVGASTSRRRWPRSPARSATR